MLLRCLDIAPRIEIFAKQLFFIHWGVRRRFMQAANNRPGDVATTLFRIVHMLYTASLKIRKSLLQVCVVYLALLERCHSQLINHIMAPTGPGRECSSLLLESDGIHQSVTCPGSRFLPTGKGCLITGRGCLHSTSVRLHIAFHRSNSTVCTLCWLTAYDPGVNFISRTTPLSTIQHSSDCQKA
jgi:hypothetical protein